MRVPRIASNDEGSGQFSLDRNKIILCCARAGCLLEGFLLKWIWKGILSTSLRHQPMLLVKATYENRLKSVEMFSALPLRPKATACVSVATFSSQPTLNTDQAFRISRGNLKDTKVLLVCERHKLKAGVDLRKSPSITCFAAG